MTVRARDVEIRRPCPVRLDPDRAKGNVRAWYCGHCEKSVHVLSNMTEVEARTFLAERAGEDLCVTYAVRRDGSIRFAPQAVPPPARDSALVPLSALARRRNVAAAAVTLGLALAACAPHDNPGVQAGLRVSDPPAHTQRASPTIPDAPRPAEPDEIFFDGNVAPKPIEPEEQLVDGELDTFVQVEGGLKAAPLPPDPAADAPCDAPPPAFPKIRRGTMRLR
jgi:hypothetical protein